MNGSLDRRARQAWDELSEPAKREAIYALRDYLSDAMIARATKLSVEVVRQILAERNEATE